MRVKTSGAKSWVFYSYWNGRQEKLPFGKEEARVLDQRPGGGHVEFDYAVHFLYDDTDLAEDVRSLMGIILKNDAEVIAMQNIINALNTLFDKYGTDLSDHEYINKPEWKNIVDATRVALDILR